VTTPGGTGRAPFGLTAPKRILVPRFRCAGTTHDKRVLILGAGEAAPRIVRHDYGGCPRGCCQPETAIVLSVPCDNLPHCIACECGDGHEYRLSGEEIRQLKDLLPW